MFPSVRLASEDESARTSERRFWVTDKGLFSSFPFQIIEDFTFLWRSIVSRVVVGLEPRDKELSDRVR